MTQRNETSDVGAWSVEPETIILKAHQALAGEREITVIDSVRLTGVSVVLHPQPEKSAAEEDARRA